ncbi:hypothetical protein E2C01_062871 [Portunus trituberculatus]|uniref:Uncharacterized protein n=1 Tax=Portunus trituberculatus TaxID=210409 RepID=A0A5B7HH95_PORTR|nr:hypothetical protein [Portunus trituberculatus]
MAGRWGCQVSPSEWDNSFVTPKYTELMETLRVEKEARYFHSPSDSRNHAWSSNMSCNPAKFLFAGIFELAGVICRNAARTRRRCTVFWSPGILGQIWISTTLPLIASTTPPGA